jgi:hypothetical protein
LDFDAVLFDVLVIRTGDDGNLDTLFGEQGTIETADGAGADDEYFHDFPSR